MVIHHIRFRWSRSAAPAACQAACCIIVHSFAAASFFKFEEIIQGSWVGFILLISDESLEVEPGDVRLSYTGAPSTLIIMYVCMYVHMLSSIIDLIYIFFNLFVGLLVSY